MRFCSERNRDLLARQRLLACFGRTIWKKNCKRCAQWHSRIHKIGSLPIEFSIKLVVCLSRGRCDKNWNIARYNSPTKCMDHDAGRPFRVNFLAQMDGNSEYEFDRASESDELPDRYSSDEDCDLHAVALVPHPVNGNELSYVIRERRRDLRAIRTLILADFPRRQKHQSQGVIIKLNRLQKKKCWCGQC